MAKILPRMLTSISSLSSVQRYSQSKLATPESVLEHSGFVTLMAYYIGTKLSNEYIHIDMDILLRKAIVHDIDEIITGDIARPIKYSSDKLRLLLGELEDEAVKDIDESLDLHGILYNDWSTAKEGLEGAIISLCDTLAVLYKCYDEVVCRGNLTMILYSEGIGQLVEKKALELELLCKCENDFITDLISDIHEMVEQISSKNVNR